MSRICLSLLFGLFSFPLWGATDAEKLQRLEASPVTASSLLQLVLGLLLVLAVIVLIAWLLRRLPGWNSSVNGALKIVAALPVGQRERVVVVQVGEQQLLIGVAAGQVELLHLLEQPLPDSSAAQPGNGKFAQRLAAAINKREQ